MMVDAEQTYLQVAIDALTIALQQRYNQESSVIMNTYQCYLKVPALSTFESNPTVAWILFAIFSTSALPVIVTLEGEVFNFKVIFKIRAIAAQYYNYHPASFFDE